MVHLLTSDGVCVRIYGHNWKIFLNRKSSFAKQMIVLITTNLLLTVANSYVPQGWWQVRDAMACLELTFMGLAMVVAMRRVLEDY
jgi:hypothetical protein